MAENENSKQLECQSTTKIGTASSEKITASIREVDAEQHLEQEENDPEPPWEWTWACVRNRLEKDLWVVLRNHPLFGIKLVKKNDNYNRLERVFGLLAFVAMQLSIQGRLRGYKLFDQAYCDCIQGEIAMEGFSDMPVCNYKGLSVDPPYYNFSLPIDGSEYKKDWSIYFWLAGNIGGLTNAVEHCRGFQEINWLGKDWESKTECGPTKYCCYAYTVSKISSPEIELKMPTYIIPMNYRLPQFTHNSPCYSAMWSTFTFSIIATLISYSCTNPLVKWLLQKESIKWNPLAYLIVLLQIFYGGYWLVVNADRSEDLAEKDPFGAAVTLVVSILLSLFVTSVIVGLLLQSVVMPLLKKYCSCCCKKKTQETTKQSETHHNPEENEQPQKMANLSETNVELEKQETVKQSETNVDLEKQQQQQETAKQSETHDDPEEQKRSQKTGKQSEAHINLEEQEQPQKKRQSNRRSTLI